MPLISTTQMSRHPNRTAETMKKVLIWAGADVNKQDTNGMTALMLAALTGEHAEAVMKVLIESGANLNSHADSDSFTPLMRTCEHGQVAACKPFGSSVPLQRSPARCPPPVVA